MQGGLRRGTPGDAGRALWRWVAVRGNGEGAGLEGMGRPLGTRGSSCGALKKAAPGDGRGWGGGAVGGSKNLEKRP